MIDEITLDISKVTAEEIQFLRESNAIEDVFDIDSLQQAIWAWEFVREQKELDNGVLLKAHKILMLHSKLRPDEKGYFRTKDAVITKKTPVDLNPENNTITWKTEVVRKLLDPKQIRKSLTTWFVMANKSDVTEEWCKQTHIMYENIHPFVDGNGRTGRMFLNWQRLQCGLPLLIIQADERKKYYEWFK